ncbi:hypothetical protein VPHK122_0009 [Vibrio phage K122]
MTIEINEKDVNRALRVARMVAKCDCQEKGGSIDNHFATIICDNHDRMVEEIAELKGALLEIKNTPDVRCDECPSIASAALAKLNQEGGEQ